MDRVKVIQAVIDNIKAKTYLEIGINYGRTFLKIRAKRKIAVDPEFNVSGFKKFRHFFKNSCNINNQYYRMTSDMFFDQEAGDILKSGVDVAFIDGLHTYKQSLKDVLNTLKYLNEYGVIVMHDCNPSSEKLALPLARADNQLKKSVYDIPGWCGDVWKTIPYLRSTKQNLQIFVLDCDFGLGIVKKGYPENRLNYSKEDIDKMTYENLSQNRIETLNLKQVEYLNRFLTS